MTLSGTLFADDEELGKKDDDHRPNGGLSRSPAHRLWRGPRRRRVFLGILGLIVLYLFFMNMPTDVPPVRDRKDLRFSPQPVRTGTENPPPLPSPPKGAPPRLSRSPTDAEKHYFDGPIKFYNLAQTLQSVYNAMGRRGENRNVLFAASSLKSASILIPMACEMTNQNRNRVHLVIMGRDDISLDAIKEVNGVDDKDCFLRWHDGRPDYSPWSSDFRMEVSVKASLGHVNTFMHPQVIITDSPSDEDAFFSKGIKDKAHELGLSLIELPSNSADSLSWITRLDSSSLRAWNNVQIEILIHAPLESSGSLIRLIKSIEKADYFDSSLPGLTIELPSHVDPPTLRFLENLRWPPHSNNEAPNSKVTLRHRIRPQGITAAEASIRSVESFYPRSAPSQHLLLLSPQAELSPSYYHYIKYTLLEYKHSSSAFGASNRLLGISLELPSTQLNGEDSFLPPTLTPGIPYTKDSRVELPTHFLYQAPNSNAALYFSDKWVELHSFLSNRFAAQSKYKTPPTRRKLVSEQYPAWMEYLLELMRTRGYSMLYPSFLAKADISLVTIHNELAQWPEEFTHGPKDASTDKDASSSDDITDPFISDLHQDRSPSQPTEPTLAQSPPLLSLIGLPPDIGQLPELHTLPILSYKGTQIAEEKAEMMYKSFAKTFATEVGGCVEQNYRRGKRRMWATDDLFCLGDNSDDEDDAPHEEDLEQGGVNAAAAAAAPKAVQEGPTSTVLLEPGMMMAGTATTGSMSSSVLPTGLLMATPDPLAANGAKAAMGEGNGK